MKLSDVRLEMTALRTMTESHNKMAGAGLLASVTKEHFYDEVAIEVYQRILAVLERESRVPKWSELSIDPLLTDEVREELDSYTEIKPLVREKRIHGIYDKLDHYRKARSVFFRSEKNLEILQKSKVDVDSLIAENVDSLLKSQISARKQDSVVTIGTKKDNSDDLFEKILSGKRADVIRTGFRSFDERNGGIMLGSLWVIAATTGGGKSAMVAQVMKNMAGSGHRVCGVPLEMTDQEMMARIISNNSEIDLKKYLFTKLTKREQRQTRKRWAEYKAEINRLGGALRIFEPESDMAIEEILTLLRPYNDEVIIIDYIGLLKGVDGDDSWRQLGKAARYAKVWARNNKRVVVLLAQLSDEGAIRYAKSIQEHANNMWSWTYGDKNRETGIIDIQQPKARNQEAFEFQLGHDFSTMSIYDLDGQDDDTRASRRSEKGSRKRDRMAEAVDELQEETSRDLRRRERRNRTGRKRNRDGDKKGGRKRERYLKDRSA